MHIMLTFQIGTPLISRVQQGPCLHCMRQNGTGTGRCLADRKHAAPPAGATRCSACYSPSPWPSRPRARSPSPRRRQSVPQLPSPRPRATMAATTAPASLSRPVPLLASTTSRSAMLPLRIILQPKTSSTREKYACAWTSSITPATLARARRPASTPPWPSPARRCAEI